jgi:hypothetical protein
MKPLSSTFLNSSLVFALVAGTLVAHADYHSTILGDSPAAYWRLDESYVNRVCTNYGSGKSALNAYYNLGAFTSQPSALPGDTGRSTGFDGANGRVEIPYTPVLNPVGPFSVEFWALRTSGSGAYYAPIWSRGAGASGYNFYVLPGNNWTFWVGATNAAGGTWCGPASTTAIANNTWYHVVGTYGPVLNGSVTNWYVSLYVNGVLQKSLQLDTVSGGSQYGVNPVTGAYSCFRMGNGGATMPGGYPWVGYLDEAAFYTNTLTSLQISNHWYVGTNAARTVSYFSTITNDAPFGYWRLDETNAPIAYNQTGTTVGAAGNGVFEGSPNIPSSVDPETGIPINPQGYPGTLEPLTSGALSGSGDSNPTINLTPLTAGGSTGAKVEVPNVAGLNTRTFSVECWANLQSLGSWNNPASSRYSATGVWGGWDLLIDGTGKLQFWLGTGENARSMLVTSTSVFATGTWNHLVAAYDGTYSYLYCNGQLVGTMLAPQYFPNPGTALRIGGGASETVQGNFYVNGKVDEAAYYPYSLSPAQVYGHYIAGLGTIPPPVAAPTFVVQPQGGTVETGGSASLTGIAIGDVPMIYQWYKDTTLMPNQTNCTLNLSNLTTAGSGTYALWATNGAGASSTSTYLTVNAPSAPQMITDLPLTTPFYPGASPRLSIVVGGSVPLTYYWTSNGVTVGVTSQPALILTNLQVGANGAHYGLTISNASGTLPSAGTTLQAMTTVSDDYVARAMALNPLAYWRLGESSGTVAADCWGGNNGQYVNVGQHVVPGALATHDDGCAQLTGSGSSIVVPAGSAFDNFSTTNQFTLMAWVKPDVLTSGNQRVFSTYQSTNYTGGATYSGGFAFGLYTNYLRFSAFGVADLNFSFSPGFVAGSWYNIVAVYSNKTVTCYVNGSVVGTANTAVNALMVSSAPLYLGGNPSGTEPFTGAVDEVAIYGSALTSFQVISIFGLKPGITVAPAPVTVLAGGCARFSIMGSGGAPLSYQWRTNNVALPGQTNTTLALSYAPLAWSGRQIACVITNVYGSITSTPVALTVIAGSGYVGSVLADGPVAYWRLDEAGGGTAYDYVATHDGAASGSVTYQDAALGGGALAGGGDADGSVAFNGSGVFVVPFYPELNQSKYSVEFWTYDSGTATDWAAPVATRNATVGSGFIFYAGLANNFLGYTWQHWTATGNTGDPWDYGVGSTINNYAWTHLAGTYDGTNEVLYVNGIPVEPHATTFATNSTYPLTIGAGNSGLYAAFRGGVDEVAYYGRALSPNQVMGHYLLAGYGDSQAPLITQDLMPQVAYAGTTFSLQAAVVGSIPLTYQWYKDGSPVPGRGGTTYCATNLFAWTFPNVQLTDAGSYMLGVGNSAGTNTTATVSLTVAVRPQLSPISLLSSGGGCQLRFSGPAGQSYRLWTSTNLALTPIETTWTLLTNNTFSGSADTFTDSQAQIQTPEQFYILTIP